jgi:hypothetical protein
LLSGIFVVAKFKSYRTAMRQMTKNVSRLTMALDAFRIGILQFFPKGKI